MSYTFRVGITPDFYVDAKGRFEAALESKLTGVKRLEFAPMPAVPNKTATPESIKGFDAIFALGLKFTRESVQGADRLALIARWGVGYDMIDVPAITENDILLAITPEAVKRPVAEAVFTYIFMLAKNVMEQNRITREGKWRGDLSRLGICLPGRTLGSLGCGNIAQEMFRLAKPLGFGRMIAHDPYADKAAAKKLQVELVSMEELFQQSDFVTVNCLLNEQTKGMVKHEHFHMMKTTAFFINTARGAIVDQKAMTRALLERRILGAGIDVFEEEPICDTDPLLAMDNVILSPHAMAWTEEIARDNGLEACNNILELFRGKTPHGAVNTEVLKQPGFLKKVGRYKK